MPPTQNRPAQGQQKYYLSFFSGGIAGICGKTTISPIERIIMIFVTRQNRLTVKEAWKETVMLFKNHGLKTFWRGNAPVVFRVIPFASINFSMFDYTRRNVY